MTDWAEGYMSEPPGGIAATDYVAEMYPEETPAGPVAAEQPDASNPSSNATPEEKRRRLMVAGAAYREEPYRQVAALTWATVEVRDALREQNETARQQVEATRENTAAVEAQTAALSAQTAVLARQAELMEQQVEWTRLQAQAAAAIAGDNRLGLQLAFYNTDRDRLAQAGVLVPFMEHLGITEAVPQQRQEPVTDDFS